MKWKRVCYSEPGKFWREPAYLAIQEVHICNGLRLYCRAFAKKIWTPLLGTNPWRVEIRIAVAATDQAWDFYHSGQSFNAVKAIAEEELKNKLQSLKKKTVGNRLSSSLGRL